MERDIERTRWQQNRLRYDAVNREREGRYKFVAGVLLGTFLLVMFIPAVSHALDVSVSENSKSIGRYYIYELTMFHSGSYSNPWEDVVITAVFSSPSSRTYTVGGFYYDTDTWKLRFAPMEEGSWTWDLIFDNGSETLTDFGGFNCVNSNNSGFLRIHPQNPYRFVTDGDNKPFYPMGFNDVIYDQAGPKGFGGSSDGTLNSDWWMHAEYVGWPIDSYFDTFADAGNNIFRMNTQTNTYLLHDRLNIGGTGKNSYLVAEGKLTDQLAQTLHDGGWKFYMVFWQRPNLGWDLSDANVRQATLAYHKYVIDRWGAYVDIWELMNERSSQDDRYFDDVTTFIRDYDPYGHMISTSNRRPDLASIEINSPHRYDRNNTLDIHRLLAGSINNLKAAHAKPVLYGEFGNSYPPYTNYDPERYRIFLWTAMFNEAALVFWHTGYAKNYQSGAGNMFIGPEERAFSRIFSSFIVDFDALARPISVALSPLDEIYASALGSSEDIGIYFTHTASHTTTLSGATVTLGIPDDGMQGLWLDPFTGNVLQNFTVDSGGRTLTIPDFQVDIALRIRRAGSNWTAVADAGPDQMVIDTDDDGSEEVTLDASGSSDPDGTIVSYVWTEDGDEIATSVKSTVPLTVGTHAITLAVTDNMGAIDTDDVEITVNPVDTPTITVLTPSGGETYTVGQTITVTWTSTNYNGNVRIVSNHGGYRWDSWAGSTENDGSWTSLALPDGITKYPSTGWKFRVAAADDREPSDESGSFSIRKAGTSITLTPLADSWIQDEGGNSRDTNMGESSLMAIGGRWHNTYFRGLIRFNLSSIPCNATVSNASLRLSHTMNAVEGSNVNDIRVYGLLRDWKEHEVTWNNYAAAAPWAAPGAGSIGKDRENTPLAQQSFASTTPVYQYYDFDVTSAIQDYIDGVKPNYGFILVGKEAPAANRYFTGFSTKESASNPPLLDITYTPPPSAQPPIQVAIDDAGDGDTIVIEPGHYCENINFKGKNLTLRSTDPNDPAVVAATVIKGRGHGLAVTFSSGEDADCILAGFTITNVNAGIYCSGASPTITNCCVTDNSGAGIELRNGSKPTITKCRIAANAGNGIEMWPEHSGRLTVYNYPTITNSVIAGNLQHGIVGGIPTITNCTIVANQRSGISGLMPAIANSIIYYNDAAYDVVQIESDFATVTYSDVQGGWDGTGNINADPCFVGPGYWDGNGVWIEGDYHLLPYSPCINAGTNTPEGGLPETDIDGEDRVMLGRVDMGADEFNPFEARFAVVNRARVERTVFEYECEVTLENTSRFVVKNVQLEMVKASENMAIVDPNVTFGGIEIAAGGSATSTDTCTFRVDRAQAIEPAKIIWWVRCDLAGTGQTLEHTGSSAVSGGVRERSRRPFR